MWFNILKAELASQSGYAQLDFDNIVEEDDENCKREWQRLAKKVEEFALEQIGEPNEAQLPNYEIKVMGKSVATAFWEYADRIPEEVYCKALDMLKNNIVGRAIVGDYVVKYINDSRSHGLLIEEDFLALYLGLYYEPLYPEDEEEFGSMWEKALSSLLSKFKGVLK